MPVIQIWIEKIVLCCSICLSRNFIDGVLLCTEIVCLTAILDRKDHSVYYVDSYCSSFFCFWLVYYEPFTMYVSIAGSIHTGSGFVVISITYRIFFNSSRGYYKFQVVLACRYNSRARTKQGQVQLISQHFCDCMHTALLASLARTNMNSALGSWQIDPIVTL